MIVEVKGVLGRSLVVMELELRISGMALRVSFGSVKQIRCSEGERGKLTA